MIVVGLIVSAGSVVIFRELIVGDRWLGRAELLRADEEDGGGRAGTTWQRLSRVGSGIVFLPVFLWKVLLAGVNMAFLAFKPSLDFWPGIVRVEGDMRTVSGTTLFANLLTLTPGTLTIDYDEEGDALYVHWIDVTGYGEDDFDHRVTSGMRVWMRRIGA